MPGDSCESACNEYRIITDGPANTRPRPVVLCVLDGWGWRDDGPDNAIALARHPNFARMIRDCPHALLATSGRAVGLPEGQMGNSEVGHANIGAGRLVMQDLPRIDDAIRDGSLASLLALQGLIRATQRTGGAVHLMGLMSPGGVHSHQEHIVALARILTSAGCVSKCTHSSTAAIPRRSAEKICQGFPHGDCWTDQAAHRNRQRPLLRHGSRQTLGTRGESLSRYRIGRGRAL